ncbi:hypothetical protein BST81_09655 [Leptolyngbya sp. 'hensonii']|nr:hypothetical protein BST81_09655 [Leptolyngbya sp. 'hensonii']
MMKHLLSRSRRRQNHALHPEQVRAAKLADLGAYLRQMREAQSLTLEQISIQTKISQRLLRAIEQGSLDHLPEPVYIQGFIKRYAETLGLDGTLFANQFPIGSVLQSAAPRSLPSWRSLPAAQLQPMHLYLLYIFLVIGAVNGLSSMIDRDSTQAISPTEIQEEFTLPSDLRTAQAPDSKQSASPLKAVFPMGQLEAESRIPASPKAQPDPQITLPADPTVMGKPVRVSVTLTGQSWVRVTTDNKVEFEGVLPEGTQRIWAATKQVTIRAGNAGGVLVAFNNALPKPLGSPGSVEEVTFPQSSDRLTQPDVNQPDGERQAQGSIYNSLF